MMRAVLGALAALALTACTTTQSRTAADVKPASIAPGAKVLVLEPDVQLSLILAAGIPEPKEDWSSAARDNLAAASQVYLRERGHALRTIPDRAASLEGRTGQVIRLQQAVAESVITFNYGFLRLPTKKNAFDWTIGEGASLLAAQYDADYALLTYVRGGYASGGRIALAILAGAPTGGGQQVYSQLVDLKTGRLVWTQVATAAPGTDMRTAAGAQQLIASILKEAPL